MKLYKVLSADGKPCHGGTGRWNLPTQNEDGSWTPGPWMTPISDIVPCERGYHLCRREDVLRWLGETLWEAEYRGELTEAEDKVVVSEPRLLRPVAGFTERNLRLYACRCAEDVLPLFETQYPGDPRPRQAIETARRYANGAATEAELAAAPAAAWSATRYAARAAACAARAAARAAARDAAWDAAWDAAGAAAWGAAYAARDAAWDAAAYAARAAARDAAWAAAWAKYTDWFWEAVDE